MNTWDKFREALAGLQAFETTDALMRNVVDHFNPLIGSERSALLIAEGDRFSWLGDDLLDDSEGTAKKATCGRLPIFDKELLTAGSWAMSGAALESAFDAESGEDVPAELGHWLFQGGADTLLVSPIFAGQEIGWIVSGLSSKTSGARLEEISSMATAFCLHLGTLHEWVRLRKGSQTTVSPDTKDDVIESLRTQLAGNAKMAALGEMAGGIAHEINNPLAIISGYAGQIEKLLKRKPGDIDTPIKRSQAITKTVERIAKIIRGLKLFSRQDSAEEFRSYSIGEMVEEILALCEHRFRNHGVELKVDIPENTILLCQPVRLSQVVINLLNNAHDAVLEQSKEGWIAIDTQKRDDGLEIRITDSGKGIAEELREKILQPFFTTKPLGKGTGLGLSLSKGIVDGHHGKLSIDASHPNTRFVVFIPWKQPESQAEAA